jgi:hypothetical protein
MGGPPRGGLMVAHVGDLPTLSHSASHGWDSHSHGSGTLPSARVCVPFRFTALPVPVELRASSSCPWTRWSPCVSPTLALWRPCAPAIAHGGGQAWTLPGCTAPAVVPALACGPLPPCRPRRTRAHPCLAPCLPGAMHGPWEVQVVAAVASWETLSTRQRRTRPPVEGAGRQEPFPPPPPGPCALTVPHAFPHALASLLVAVCFAFLTFGRLWCAPPPHTHTHAHACTRAPPFVPQFHLFARFPSNRDCNE